MTRISIALLFVLLCANNIQAQTKQKIQGQAPEFPLYTQLNEDQLKPFANAFEFPLKSLDKIIGLRNFLRPYVAKKDPVGEFLFATTFDLYPYGYGDSISADTALLYYHKAADHNYAEAEGFLYSAYKNGFMTLKENDSLAYIYLKRFVVHGDAKFKVRGCKDLALMYYDGGFYNIEADTLKTIEYLEKALQYDSTDTWTLDFLGGLYEDQGNYKKAIYYKLKSNNDQSRLKVANWLIKGIHVENDFKRGFAILLEELRKNPNDWRMRSYDALEMINRLYCSKIISREQLGHYHRLGYCD